MAYTIYNNDGSVLLTLAEGKIDSVSTSLDLIGKNVNNYGEIFNNNLIKLLTNSANINEESPRSPVVGQLWFNTTNKRLNVYDGTGFRPASGSLVSGTEPSVSTSGDFWYDSLNGQLKIFDGSQYKVIGPQTSGLDGKFGIEIPPTPIRNQGTNIPQKVGVVYSYGSSVGLITTGSFVMSTASSVTYFNTSVATTVVAGLTLLQNLEIKGDIYIRGNQRTPIKTLSAFYDITQYGNPADSGASSAANQTVINTGNNAIRFDLAKIFPVQASTQYNQTAYPLGSEVRVLCKFNNDTSVRRFILRELISGSPNWEPYNLYFNDFSQSLTNIVI